MQDALLLRGAVAALLHGNGAAGAGTAGAGHTSSVHGPFLIDGSRLFIQRSLHCFPVRPDRAAATVDHCLVPYLLTCHTQRRMVRRAEGQAHIARMVNVSGDGRTIPISFSSSPFVHGPRADPYSLARPPPPLPTATQHDPLRS
jgi:hypothetical protein